MASVQPRTVPDPINEVIGLVDQAEKRPDANTEQLLAQKAEAVFFQYLPRMTSPMATELESIGGINYKKLISEEEAQVKQREIPSEAGLKERIEELKLLDAKVASFVKKLNDHEKFLRSHGRAQEASFYEDIRGMTSMLYQASLSEYEEDYALLSEQAKAREQERGPSRPSPGAQKDEEMTRADTAFSPASPESGSPMLPASAGGAAAAAAGTPSPSPKVPEEAEKSKEAQKIPKPLTDVQEKGEGESTITILPPDQDES